MIESGTITYNQDTQRNKPFLTATAAEIAKLPSSKAESCVRQMRGLYSDVPWTDGLDVNKHKQTN